MRKKRKLRLLLGAALAAVLFTGAAGASQAPRSPGSAPGQTTVEVQTADMDSKNLSFTVPLYLTVAAAEDDSGTSQVIVPDGYLLKNTTGSVPDGSYPDIAVTGLSVKDVPGGTWSIRKNPADPKDISLTIGGLPLPDVTAGSNAEGQADITATDNSFYSLAAGTYKPISGGPAAAGLNLPIAGRLSGVYVPGEAQAAAQFRITYTVSLMDAGGQPVGVYYDGPSKEDAETASPAAVVVPPAPAGP